NHGVSEPPAPSHPQPAIVEKRALASLGYEKLVGYRIVNESGDEIALPLERNGDCEMRYAVQEIQRAVERIDDPAVRPVAPFAAAAFLPEKTVARPRVFEFFAQNLFGAPICRRHEISRTFDGD